MVGRSNYFRALLAGGLKEGTQQVLEVDVSETAFVTNLRFIYTKTIDLEAIADDIVDVFVTAGKYIVPELKNLLEGVISSNLTVENVASLLIVADQQAAPRLRRACIELILNNKKAVMATPDYHAFQSQIEEILSQNN